MKRLLLTTTVLFAMSFSQAIDSLILLGDEHYLAREHEKSLAVFHSVLDLDENNIEALWRIGRTEWYLGDIEKMNENEEAMILHFEAGRDISEKAMNLDENHGPAILWYASNFGELILTTMSVFDQAPASIKVHELANKALEIIDSSDNEAWKTTGPLDGALHLLGQWNYDVLDQPWIFQKIGSLAGIPDASYGDAEKYFKRSCEVMPTYLKHWLYLGKTYIEMDEDEKARDALQEVLDRPWGDVGDEKIKLIAQELLEDL